MKKSKQQKSINSFFKKKKKKDENQSKKQRTPSSILKKIADKENNNAITLDDLDLPPLSVFAMGCKSQDRKGSIQKAKERTFRIQQALREAKANGQKVKPKNPQRKLDGSVAEPRCDDPDNPKECTACTKTEEYKKRGKEFKGWAHHFSCPHNKDYYNQLFGEKSESTKAFDAEVKRIAKANNQPLPGPDLHVRKEDGVKFFSPRNLNSVSVPNSNSASPSSSSSSSPSLALASPSSNNSVAFDPFEVEYLTKKVKQYMEDPTTSMKRGKTVPNVIGAAVEALLEITPRKFRCSRVPSLS